MANYLTHNPKARELIEECVMREFNEGLTRADVAELVEAVTEHFDLDPADCVNYTSEVRSVFAAQQPDLGRTEPVQPAHSSLSNESPEPHWMSGYKAPRRKAVIKKYEPTLKYFKHRPDSA